MVTGPTVNSLGPGGRVGRLRIANWKLEIGNLAGGEGGGQRAAGRWQMAELRRLTARESRRLRGFAHELCELHEFGLTAAWLVAEGKGRGQLRMANGKWQMASGR
jgi:hypothetical protein